MSYYTITALSRDRQSTPRHVHNPSTIGGSPQVLHSRNPNIARVIGDNRTTRQMLANSVRTAPQTTRLEDP